MIARHALRSLLAVALLSASSARQAAESVAFRLLASRAELLAEVARLDAAPRPSNAERLARAVADQRLHHGDFRPGDLLIVDVVNEAALADTFLVHSDTTLQLPPPTLGALSLRGVLRSEAPDSIAAFVARFLLEPRVVVRPLVRIAVDGEVARAGYYAVPADLRLSDVLMVASGMTARADLRKVVVERDGHVLLDHDAMRRALAHGWTVDEAMLREGDAITVGRDGGPLEDRLRFLWLLVSLTGGLYGLSRAL